MGYGATFGILGGHGPLGPPPKSAYELPLRNRTNWLLHTYLKSNQTYSMIINLLEINKN